TLHVGLGLLSAGWRASSSAPSPPLVIPKSLGLRLRSRPTGDILMAVDEDFEERPVRQSDELTLALDGWEGPLDLLLNLARAQKVDLAQISILQLVEQYLAYLSQARALKLEIAADYLVMAAWLAYLKSCLLLPKDLEAEPSPD